LHGHRFGDELRVELGLLDLLNVDEHLAAGPLLDFLLQLVHLGAFAADDDAGLRGVDVDLQLVRGALGLDLRDSRVREAFLEALAQRDVLVEQLRVIAIRVPPGPPRLVEPEPESERVNLLPHVCSLVRRRAGSMQSGESRTPRPISYARRTRSRRRVRAAPRLPRSNASSS